jgi:putative tryptophan/tyrosine transport system substrate-binding protein
MMQRRQFITLFGGAVVCWPLAARAQQPDGMRRLGVLMPFDVHNAFGREIVDTLRDGLQQHGWIEGRNIRSDIRWIGDDEERRRAYAADLVRASPDVIFACFAAQLAALSRETAQIPLVFVGVTDPVGLGYVASYAKPGGNITGFTFFEQAMVGKWLGVLKEVAPTLTRAAVILNPDTQKSYEVYLAEFASVARAFKVESVSLLVHSPSEIESVIREFAANPNGGLIVLPDTFTTDHYQLIVALASRNRLPTVYQFAQAARSGGLLAYGPDQIDVIRRSASYVDRILKGEKPAELPVQTPTKFELVINLAAAKALGIVVPPTLLARADEVVE